MRKFTTICLLSSEAQRDSRLVVAWETIWLVQAQQRQAGVGLEMVCRHELETYVHLLLQ